MHLVRLCVALALTLAASADVFAGDVELTKRFLTSDYTVCDAHFVARTFDFTTREAKAYIGQKIEWGSTDILNVDLQNARIKGQTDRLMRCQFYQTQFTIADATALAAYWGVTLSEAKVRVEDKILQGNESYLAKQVLVDARSRHIATNDVNENDNRMDPVQQNRDLTAFFNSRFDICHANMLMKTFGGSLSNSKALIGAKVAGGWASTVDEYLQTVRGQHQAAGTKPCNFHQTPYSSTDAARLASFWGSSVSEAKARVEQKYAWGTEAVVKNALETGKSPKSPARR